MKKMTSFVAEVSEMHNDLCVRNAVMSCLDYE